MPGADYLLAVALLTVPPGTPAGCPPAETWPTVRDAVQRVAVEWQILDARETRYILTRPEEFCTDLNMLRRRHQELADAPLLEDSLRFPDRPTVNDLIRSNRAYRKHIDLRSQLETDRTTALNLVLKETDQLYQVWDAVRDARCDFYYVTVRRQALKRLRNLVGEDAYAEADLPPAVPTWRFQFQD